METSTLEQDFLFGFNIKDETLLFNNALLLGLDLNELKKMNVIYKPDTFQTERKDNQKIMAYLLNFLLEKLTEGSSVVSLSLFIQSEPQ